MMRLGRMPFFQASAYTAPADAMAPRKATGVSSSAASGRKISMTTPARPAPLDTPTMPGSASGFFMTACRIAPDTARSAPTSAPVRFLGKRIFQMTVPSVPVTGPNSVARMRPKAISAEPKIRLPIMAAAVKIRKADRMPTRSARLFPAASVVCRSIFPPPADRSLPFYTGKAA